MDRFYSTSRGRVDEYEQKPSSEYPLRVPEDRVTQLRIPFALNTFKFMTGKEMPPLEHTTCRSLITVVHLDTKIDRILLERLLGI